MFSMWATLQIEACGEEGLMRIGTMRAIMKSTKLPSLVTVINIFGKLKRSGVLQASR